MYEKFNKPFSDHDLEWRVQRAFHMNQKMYAIVVPYVTNRAIMARLDDTVGLVNWKNEYKEWREKGVLCGISIKIGDEWITKWDGADETYVESTKGGFSASSKRAAVTWGIGRYLYELPEARVEITQNRTQGSQYVSTQLKDKSWIKGYWVPPKLENIKKGSFTNNPNSQTQRNNAQNANQGNQPTPSSRNNPQNTQSSNGDESRYNDLKDYIVRGHKILQLSNAEQIAWFNRVNPEHNVQDITGILKSDYAALLRYNDIIKWAASIKKIVMDEQSNVKWVFGMLSDFLGQPINDFKQLIANADNITFDSVKKQIFGQKNNRTA